MSTLNKYSIFYYHKQISLYHEIESFNLTDFSLTGHYNPRLVFSLQSTTCDGRAKRDRIFERQVATEHRHGPNEKT